jgi:hypothetical protein
VIVLVIAIAIGIWYFAIRDDNGGTSDTSSLSPTPSVTLSPAEVGAGLATP